MADLYRVFKASDGDVELQTDYVDPIRKVRNLYLHTKATKEIENYEQIESLFIKLDDDLWDDDWDHRCALADLPMVKTYLLEALKYLKEISDDDGNLQEPYRSYFLAIERTDLRESGFFYWEHEDQVKPREFIPAVTDFIGFLDKVMSSNSDLMRRTDN